jgi:hypothetical protein
MFTHNLFHKQITGRDGDGYNFYRTLHGQCTPLSEWDYVASATVFVYSMSEWWRGVQRHVLVRETVHGRAM